MFGKCTLLPDHTIGKAPQNHAIDAATCFGQVATRKMGHLANPKPAPRDFKSSYDPFETALTSISICILFSENRLPKNFHEDPAVVEFDTQLKQAKRVEGILSYKEGKVCLELRFFEDGKAQIYNRVITFD